jgi:hypothetical protein
MKYGSGNTSVVRVAGDDKAQIWGQWHYAGHSAGIYQGLFCMYANYHTFVCASVFFVCISRVFFGCIYLFLF